MYERLVFTNDPQYFPLAKMRQIVSDLHAGNQHYSEKPTFLYRLSPLMLTYSTYGRSCRWCETRCI